MRCRPCVPPSGISSWSAAVQWAARSRTTHKMKARGWVLAAPSPCQDIEPIPSSSETAVAAPAGVPYTMGMRALQQPTTWGWLGAWLAIQLRAALRCAVALLLLVPLCICVAHSVRDRVALANADTSAGLATLLAQGRADDLPLNAPPAHCALHCTSQVLVSPLLAVALLVPVLCQRLLLTTAQLYPCASLPPLLPPPQLV